MEAAMPTDRDALSPPSKPMMLHLLARNWWMVLLRGIAALVFGILALIAPGLTWLSLIILFGIYALFDGVVAIGAAIWGESGAGPTGSRWWLAIVGVLGILAGLLTFLWPGVTMIVVLTFIGAWSLLHGIFEIIGAIRLRKEIENEWWLILSGALSVLFGLAVLVMPGAGALAIVWVVGIYAILFGVLLVGFALKLRKHAT
jgi:uncharacterized membrane protein HdeD (DUF308 family)